MLFSLSHIKHIKSADGKMLKVCDFILDFDNQRAKYLVAKVPAFWRGKKVIVPMDFISSIDFEDHAGVAQSLFSLSNMAGLRALDTQRTFSQECKEDFSDGVLSIKVNPRHKLSELREYFVESPDQNYGILRDLLVSDDNWKVKFITTDSLTNIRKDSRILPFEEIKQISWLTSSIQLDMRGIRPSQLPIIKFDDYQRPNISEVTLRYSGLYPKVEQKVMNQ